MVKNTMVNTIEVDKGDLVSVLKEHWRLTAEIEKYPSK